MTRTSASLPSGVNPAVVMAELKRLKERINRIDAVRGSFLEFARRYAPEDEQPDAHHLVVIDALQRVADGEIERLIIMQPPGTAKSNIVSQKWAAWLLGRPGHQIIAASYAAALAERNGKETRLYIERPEYAKDFDAVLSVDSAAKDHFELIHKGEQRRSEYHGVGIGGAATGFRSTTGICDDVVKNWEEADSQAYLETTWSWFKTVFMTRAKNGKMGVVICMTRWSTGDLIGRILPESYRGESGWVTARDGERWYVLRMPAQCDREDDPVGRRIGQWLWPEKIPLSSWLAMRNKLNAREWAGLYQQLPISASGGIIQRDWIKLWPADKPLPVLQFVIQSYDTAFSERTTAAESAGTDWGVAFIDEFDADGKRKQKAIVILLDCWAEHLGYPDLRKRARSRYDDMRYGAPPQTHGQKPALFGPTSHLTFALEGRKADVVLIEEKATGGPLLHDLHGYGVPVRAYNPGRASKETRLHAVSQIFQGGFVYVPESKAPERKGMPRDWAERWVNEITSAGPGAIHWDLTDSTTQALAMVRDQGWLDIRKPRVDPPTKERADPDDVRLLKRRTGGNVYAA